MISVSFSASASSIILMCWSVTFCTSSERWRCSSWEILWSFSSFLSASMPSRRTLRTAMRACSAYLWAILPSSWRRSWLSSGIGTRTSWPSDIGLTPRPASRIARSTACTKPRSQTCTVIMRDSGTLTVPTCTSGISLPYALTPTGSSRWTDARPVRNPANSRRSASSAPSMRRLISVFSSADTVLPLVPDDREPTLAGDHVGEGPLMLNREYENGDAIFARQRDGRRIHDLEVARQHFEIGQLFVALRVRHFPGIGAIDAIDLGALEQDVAAHLGGAQRGGGIGREEGIAGAGGEDDHAALFHVPHRAPADIGLAHRRHRDRGLDPRMHAQLFERVLHGERVHDGREHAHIVGRRALHALHRPGDAAEDVAAADHQADLDAHAIDGLNVAGNARHGFLVEAELLRSHQRFAGDLQEDAAIMRLQRHDGALSQPIRHGRLLLCQAAVLPPGDGLDDTRIRPP